MSKQKWTEPVKRTYVSTREHVMLRNGEVVTVKESHSDSFTTTDGERFTASEQKGVVKPAPVGKYWRDIDE